jgi:transposase
VEVLDYITSRRRSGPFPLARASAHFKIPNTTLFSWWQAREAILDPKTQVEASESRVSHKERRQMVYSHQQKMEVLEYLSLRHVPLPHGDGCNDAAERVGIDNDRGARQHTYGQASARLKVPYATIRSRWHMRKAICEGNADEQKRCRSKPRTYSRQQKREILDYLMNHRVPLPSSVGGERRFRQPSEDEVGAHFGIPRKTIYRW